MKTLYSAVLIVTATIILSAFTESRTISGIVTDENGNPLSGVTVRTEPGTSTAITGRNGYYEIEVGEKAERIVFSLPGYLTVIEKTGVRNSVNISMSQAVMHEEDLYMQVRDKRLRLETAKSAGAVYGAPYSSPAFISGNSYNRYNNNFNSEGYAPVNENGYMVVSHNPLSTFSIDVDNASYSNIRRYINMGQLPPADAVRIEEMINYFKYDYPEPSGEHPFSIYTELSECPWNRDHYLLQTGLRAADIEKSSLPPSNIVFLIDVSGSMNSPDKLPLLKAAFGLLVNELRPQDKVAIVVYAGAAGLVLESTSGNLKEKIMSALDELEAGGSTAGGEGLRLAYAEAQRNFIKGGNNRIILATDGDFNVGESSNGSMERLVEEKREQGVSITVLGFGTGNIKDDKMEIIADKGNGNYSYIDNLQEARRVLVREFGGTLFTLARDVKFQLEFNPAKVSAYRLIGYENRMLADEDFNNDKKDAGEMGSGHNVTALYELIPAGADEVIPSVDLLKYQQAGKKVPDGRNNSSEYLTIKLRYKRPDANSSIMFDKPVTGPVKSIGSSSDNLRFAAAVTEFGMILRDSEFIGNATLESAARLAGLSRGEDEDGYRAELIRLINTVKDMRTLAERE